MQRKLTITLNSEVYDGLHRITGAHPVSSFIEDLLRSYVANHDLEAAYRDMAQDEAREVEALEWAEATIGDVGNW